MGVEHKNLCRVRPCPSSIRLFNEIFYPIKNIISSYYYQFATMYTNSMTSNKKYTPNAATIDDIGTSKK